MDMDIQLFERDGIVSSMLGRIMSDLSYVIHWTYTHFVCHILEPRIFWGRGHRLTTQRLSTCCEEDVVIHLSLTLKLY